MVDRIWSLRDFVLRCKASQDKNLEKPRRKTDFTGLGGLSSRL